MIDYLKIGYPGADECEQLAVDGAHDLIDFARTPKQYFGYETVAALGAAGTALVIAGKIEEAHEVINTIGPDDRYDRFRLWASIYAAGDTSALPMARRAAGFDGDSDCLPPDGLHSAEAIVELVASGSKDDVDLARGTVGEAGVDERTYLYSKLYRAGDADSLELALASAVHAKEYMDETGQTKHHFYRVESALTDVTDHAIETGDFDAAKRSVFAQTEPRLIVEGLSKIFAANKPEVLDQLLTKMKYLQDDPGQQVLNNLALGGHKPTVNQLRKNVKQFERHAAAPRDGSFDPAYDQAYEAYYRNLATLHSVGVKNAGGKALKAVAGSHDEYVNLYPLDDANLDTREVAHTLQQRFPGSVSVKKNLLYRQFDVGEWQPYKEERLAADDAGTVSGLVRRLSKAARQKNADE